MDHYVDKKLLKGRKYYYKVVVYRRNNDRYEYLGESRVKGVFVPG
jgi:hypothetical protein